MNYDSKGILVTIVFHGIFFLLILFLGFSTPLPLPAESGFLISFGTAHTGMGDIEPSEMQAKKIPVALQSDEPDKEFMSQDIEEAPVLQQKKKEVKKQVQKPVNKKINEQKKPVEQPKKEIKKPNPLNLYHGAGTGTSGSEGLNGKDGNQGSEDGTSTNSHFIGSGTGDGMGIGYDLTGRSSLSLPRPEYLNQKEGIVVVQITVNRDGQVIDALPGVKGSTTLDTYLLEAAKKAALAARFNSKADALMYQKGTITYHFKLK